MDGLTKLYEIVDGYRATHPGGDEPFRVLARITEEAGEVAAKVNHLERTGAKVDKHGEPDKRALAHELEDLIHSALSLARYYQIESDLDDVIAETHARVAPRARPSPNRARPVVDGPQ